MAYTQADIPSQYWAKLEQLRLNRQIPISWLAAVCERTQWNPAFKVTNANYSRNTTRQIGLAGIWYDVAEVIVTPNGNWTDCSGGWAGGYKPWYAGTMLRCGFSAALGSASEAVLMDPMRNLDYATTILLDCRDAMVSRCGEVNAAIFARWILGEKYYPPKDASGKCIVDPNMLGPIKDEINALVQLQRLWAEGLGETPIVPNPVFCWDGSTPVGGQCPQCPDGSRPAPGIACATPPPGEGGIPWWVWVALIGLGGLVVIAGSGDNKNRPKYEYTTRKY